jgi:threonylcarbamoyladenosine tRNA methylthiotransferase CDKAL1
MREHLPAIAVLLNHPRCYAFLHIPVQSGSDRVLHAMRREYTAAEFREVADALLAAVPGLTIATDIICGFPGETESDHAETLRLVQQYRFPVLNISQFYPRPGTPAARLPRIATHVVKERTREVSALFASYTTLDGLVGTEQRVLVTEVASDGVHLVGHTKGYAQVLLPAVAEHMGCPILLQGGRARGAASAVAPRGGGQGGRAGSRGQGAPRAYQGAPGGPGARRADG